MLKTVIRNLQRILRRGAAPDLPAAGFPPGSTPAPLLERLTDAELRTLNGLLPWNAFTVDGKGRRLGDAAWSGKRTEPQTIPDRRIVLMDERFGLADKHVLEVGCFEGIHTIGLAKKARSVTAVDSRVENVVKTIVRAALYGCHPTAFPCNLEERPLPSDLLRADLLHHVGVLYHLKDPVSHLLELGSLIRTGVMLDTHYSLDDQATKSYEAHGGTYAYREFVESGVADPFSGMYDHSKWLRLDDLCGLLRQAGFDQVEVVEKRDERNGPRALLFARRSRP